MSTLIAAYAFNEQGLNDYSGNKYHLINNGGVTFSLTMSNNGGFGYDAIFASGQYGSNSSFPSQASLTGLTIFCNVYITSLSSTVTIAAITTSWILKVTTSGKVEFITKNSSGTSSTNISASTLLINTWYTIAGVWDGTNTYIYINGTLDSTETSWSQLNAGNNVLAVGNTFVGNMNMLEIRNSAFTANDIASLNVTPGGNLYQVHLHTFEIGDLVADEMIVNTGVVTWVQDAANIYVYPFTNPMLNSLARYGNVYNTLRQNIMETNNDFDGNGNSQISIKYPIASFSDYNSPANEITFDYRGLTGAPKNNAMAITSLRI